MSFITRCPACGTMFKVVPDQLKISDGWVRCGHCADVFDATLYLQSWVAPPPENAPAPVAPSTPLETPSGHPFVPDQAPAPQPALVPGSSAQPAWEVPLSDVQEGRLSNPVETGWPSPGAEEEGDWLVAPPAQPWSEQTASQEAADWLNPPVPSDPVIESPFAPLDSVSAQVEADPLDFEGRLEQANAPDPSPAAIEDDAAAFQAELERFAATTAGAARAVESEPVAVAAPVASVAKTDPVEPEVQPQQTLEPEFVLQARRQAFWRSPGMQALMLLLAFSLAVLLAGQWALHERDELAASRPALTPVLNLLCRTAGCELQAPRNIDAIVIDSSTLVRRLGNFYSFDLVLKNSASMPVAMPALELSLTDTADAVLSRRVFLAQELPGAPPVLPAQGTQAISLRLSLAEGGAGAMAGYRALVFYP